MLIVGRFSGDHVWPVLGVHRGFDRVDLADLREGPPAGKNRRRRVLSPIGVELGTISLHLISGTLALIGIYHAHKGRQAQRQLELELQREWVAALIGAGMRPDVAAQIPLACSADLIRFIAEQRLGAPRQG